MIWEWRKRIKRALGWMSPLEYRLNLSICAYCNFLFALLLLYKITHDYLKQV